MSCCSQILSNGRVMPPVAGILSRRKSLESLYRESSAQWASPWSLGQNGFGSQIFLSSMIDRIQSRLSIAISKKRVLTGYLSHLSPQDNAELRRVEGGSGGIILRAFTNNILRPECEVRSTDWFGIIWASSSGRLVIKQSSSDRPEIPTLLNGNYICRILEFPK